jgi:hypothetical protein
MNQVEGDTNGSLHESGEATAKEQTVQIFSTPF